MFALGEGILKCHLGHLPLTTVVKKKDNFLHHTPKSKTKGKAVKDSTAGSLSVLFVCESE